MYASETELWDTVLTHVEDDVRRTETLLAAVTDGGADGAAADLPLVGLDAVGPLLPELSTMPLIPPHMLDRIIALRERIDRLRLDVEVEMSRHRDDAWGAGRAASRLRLAPVASVPAPRFVDRRV